MDISRECMCKNNNPECVECWYSLPGYSVTETKRRLPLRTEPLTYDEEFAAFGHDNDYDGICYEVAPKKIPLDTSSNGWDWVNEADSARQRWNTLKERTARRAKKADPTFALDLAARFRECEDLMVAKHSDYGPDSITNAPGGPLNGLRVRIHDKICRINHLIDTNVDPQNESLRDSFVDLANYSVIALMSLDGTWPKDGAK